jgi:RND family efflux transporter MFP subunit
MTQLRFPSARCRVSLSCSAILLILLSACGQEAEVGTPAPRPVKTVVVEPTKLGEAVRITGDIRSQNEVAVAFRIGGKIKDRPVNVGDRVESGDLLASLDAQTEENALLAAEAALSAARGDVAKTRNAFDRQDELLRQGFTTRPRFEQAEQALNTAVATLEDAEAQAEMARDRVAFTRLYADSSGVVTARGAEPGEVVQAGQMIVSLARSDGRDAVFNVPARLIQAAPQDIVVDITMATDSTVSVTGHVREIAPQADPVTGTFEVKVGLDSSPAAMSLGSTVTGSFELESERVIAVPASALTKVDMLPAVWVVDPASTRVSLRPVDILRFEPRKVLVSQGLELGDIVVTAGVQALHPGQQVRLLPSAGESAP